MSNCIMRRFCLLCWIVALYGVLSPRLLAGEYHLTNGDIIKGEPASINEDGILFKLDIGGFSPHIRWTKFTQESLKELVKNPKAAGFVEPFIEIAPETKQEEKRKRDITIKPVENRLPNYDKVGFLEAWTTPAALMILLVLYGANLFAAYE